MTARRLALAALAAGAIVAGTPVLASAAPPLTLDCTMDAVAWEAATGGNDVFTGSASGSIVGAPGETSVSVSCQVRVNGIDVAATPTGTGSVNASTTGQVTFTADDEADVDLCAVWTTSTASGQECEDATQTQVPPQSIVDLISAIGDSGANGLLCGLLRQFHGWWGDVYIDWDGDVWVDGGRVIDCPPYGNTPWMGGPPRFLHA